MLNQTRKYYGILLLKDGNIQECTYTNHPTDYLWAVSNLAGWFAEWKTIGGMLSWCEWAKFTDELDVKRLAIKVEKEMNCMCHVVELTATCKELG